MVKYSKYLVVFLLVFFVVSSVKAKGPFITPGARATGFGTAFVSIADDLTAIYWNPAGLAYQKSKQIMFSAYYISDRATSNGGGYTKYETTALIPFLGFSMPYNETMTVAFGVYASGGGGGKVLDIEPNKIEGQQSFMIYNVSVAKTINEKLSIGIGFEGIEMKDKLVFKVPLEWFGYPSGSGETNIDYNRSAFGFQGNIGIMYKPVEKLSTGFILRSGTRIGLPKEPNASNPSSIDGYTYPMTMELGASYKALDPLTVAVAAAYNKYSWTSADYTDTVQFRIGTEYKATDKLALQLGFFTDPNIYKNSDTYTLTNIDMYNMQYLCVGAEYSVSKTINLGLTYTHSFTQNVVSNGITYEYPISMARFDVNYKF